jgi:hypothetical protein
MNIVEWVARPYDEVSLRPDAKWRIKSTDLSSLVGVGMHCRSGRNRLITVEGLPRVVLASDGCPKRGDWINRNNGPVGAKRESRTGCLHISKREQAARSLTKPCIGHTGIRCAVGWLHAQPHSPHGRQFGWTHQLRMLERRVNFSRAGTEQLQGSQDSGIANGMDHWDKASFTHLLAPRSVQALIGTLHPQAPAIRRICIGFMQPSSTGPERAVKECLAAGETKPISPWHISMPRGVEWKLAIKLYNRETHRELPGKWR